MLKTTCIGTTFNKKDYLEQLKKQVGLVLKSP